MTEVVHPESEEELAHVLERAGEGGWPLEIVGGGSKFGIGRPVQTAAQVTTTALTGITLYEPSELVLSAKAGTPLAEVEAALEAEGQELAFEPLHMARFMGEKRARPSIGGVFATNLSGARRIVRGSARDNFLGLRGVNGRGEVFKAGGRVMKNVTGYDVTRGLAGSWGTLAVMTEVTMKVLPKAEETRTLVVRGLTDELGVDLLCAALGTPYEVSGTAHLHGNLSARLGDKGLASNEALTALRIENFGDSAGYRAGRLKEIFAVYGEVEELDDARSRGFWSGLRALEPLRAADGPVWRISTAPDKGARLIADLGQRMACDAWFDWSGGLIWLAVEPATDAGAMEVRHAVSMFGGHATLVRATPAIRASVDVFEPMEPGVAGLTRGIKAMFDPHGILNPGRMYAGF